jgi:hypothetical protein
MPNNGTLVGSPTFATGKFANAISLNGTTQYVTLPNGGPQEFAAGTNWTIEGWFNASSTPHAYNIICASTNGSSPTNYFVALGATAIPIIAVNGITAPTASASAAVTLNAWHSWRLVISGSGTVATLLIDGVVVITATGTYAKATGQTAYIGGWASSASYFTGLIDEVAYWNTALSNTTYTPATVATTAPQTNLVALYHLEADATDSSAFSGSSITVSPSTATVAVSGTTTLVATPSTGTPTITWASSNTAVATVNSSGVVTGVGTGTATITASSAGYTSGTATVTVAALAAAAITVVSADSTGWTLQANSTGGAGGNTYQWQSSAFPDGTMANVAGATSQTRLFTVAAGAAPLFAQCIVTDSGAASVTSFGSAAGTVYTGSPPMPFGVVPVSDPIKAVLISDSTRTTGQRYDQAMFTQLLTSAFAPATVTVNNQSISGTSVQGWDGAILTSMIAALAAGKYIFGIGLGINDSKSAGVNAGEVAHLSASSYVTHIASICSTLLGTSKFAGSKIVLLGAGYVAAPTQYAQWDDASITLLLAYCNAIPGLCNGTTILSGSTTRRFYTYAASPTLLLDGVHETTAGGTVLAIEDATGFFQALTTTSSGGQSFRGTVRYGDSV